MKTKNPGRISFDPKTQPGYQSRQRAFSFNSLFGDAQYGLQSNRGAEKIGAELPQGLESFQLPQVFPSRRRVR